jgi:hypothetical protein
MGNFDVIFTGHIAEEMTRGQVEENLLRLPGCTSEAIAPLFRGKPLILKKNLPRDRAEAYAKTLTRAGALCRTRPSETARAGDSQSAETERGKISVRLVSPVMGPARISFAPLTCPFISRAEGGVNINRVDRAVIPFEDITLLAARYDSPRNESTLRLLVFTRMDKRPALVDADKINFATFPDVRGDNLLFSLRRFLAYLLEKNPGISLDEETYAFLQGDRPASLTKSMDELATALALAVPSNEGKTITVDRRPSPADHSPVAETKVNHGPFSAAEPAGKESITVPPVVLSPASKDQIAEGISISEKGRYRRRAIVYLCLSVFFFLGVISFVAKPNPRKPIMYTTPYSSGVFRQSPAMKKQLELLEYNRKGAQTTKIVGIIICSLLTISFFRKAYGYWALYNES